MPRIRPQSNNIKIKVSTQQTDDTVNVSTTNGTNPVKASNNMAEYWSNKSKEWAISENIVDNTDHSSKYYAEQAKEAYDGIDELVNGFEQTVEDATTNSIEEITESKDDAIADIIIEGGNQVNLVESTGGDLITQMTSLKDTTLGYKNDAQSSANSASVSETNAHTYETNALSYSNSASGSASIATQKATEAASSAINASESELNALTYSNSASTSASNASTSESNASTSETNAQTYANNANTSATNAATSEDNANIWAEGSDAEVQALGGVHSSKGWAEVSSSCQVQSDYTESDNTKKSYIKNKPDLTVYATQTNLTNGLATKQDTISDLSTIRSNAANGQSAYTTIGGYGDIVTYNASNFVQKNGDSSTQTISLTSGTGTTALGIKSMATSSYISLSGSSGWLGSYGVSSSKRAVFYNGTGYTLAYTSEIPTNTSELTNDSGYITGIDSSDVITALGYTPYNSTNPNNYTSNVGTVTSVNNTQPDANGNVTISVTGGANTDLSNLTATGEAHFAKIFIAEYGVTTYNEISTAYNAGKNIICIFQNVVNGKYYSSSFGITEVWADDTIVYVFRIMRGDNTNFYSTDLMILSNNTWAERNIALQPAFQKVTSISSSSTDNQYPSAKLLYDQLALKQSTSTAVTHTANTQVGSSTTPVYIASNGTATSTGLSIASSRFDGQWVSKHSTLADTVSMGNASIKTYSLTTYLPDSTYDYEVMFSGLVITAASSAKFLKMTLDSSVVTNVWVCDARTRTSSTMEATGSCIVPISKNSQQIVMKSEASSNSSGTMSLVALAYRRIGTNT